MAAQLLKHDVTDVLNIDSTTKIRGVVDIDGRLTAFEPGAKDARPQRCLAINRSSVLDPGTDQDPSAGRKYGGPLLPWAEAESMDGAAGAIHAERVRRLY